MSSQSGQSNFGSEGSRPHSPVPDDILDDPIFVHRVESRAGNELEQEEVVFLDAMAGLAHSQINEGQAGDGSKDPINVTISGEESMEVDQPTDGAAGNSGTVSGLVEEDFEPERTPIVSPIDLDTFGPFYKEALGELIRAHKGFATHPCSGKKVSWSSSTRDKKLEEVKAASSVAYTRLLEALFYDRNVRFRATGSSEGKPPSEDSKQETPQGGFPCNCEAFHGIIAKCVVGKGHRGLCETRLNKPFVIPKLPQIQSKPIASKGTVSSKDTKEARKKSSSKDSSSQPSTSKATSKPISRLPLPSEPPREHRGRWEERDGGRGQKRKDRSSSSRGGHSKPRQQYYQDRRSPSRGSHSAQDRLHPKASGSGSVRDQGRDLPTVGQFKRLLSTAGSDVPSSSSGLMASGDVRLKQSGHDLEVQTTRYDKGKTVAVTTRQPPFSAAEGRAPSTPVIPAKNGDSCLGPDGEVDYSRIPIKPPGLPPSVRFNAFPYKGKWKVELLQ
jgi:hypothetical protein